MLALIKTHALIILCDTKRCEQLDNGCTDQCSDNRHGDRCDNADHLRQK